MNPSILVVVGLVCLALVAPSFRLEDWLIKRQLRRAISDGMDALALNAFECEMRSEVKFIPVLLVFAAMALTFVGTFGLLDQYK